jgi:hypothetical protein
MASPYPTYESQSPDPTDLQPRFPLRIGVPDLANVMPVS